MTSLNRIYSFQVFVPSQKAWVQFRRNEMHGPGWWFCEARAQSGRVLGQRTISAEYASDIFSRYGSEAEVQYYSRSAR